jgi:SAM-dependent methyltransferase
MKTWSFIGGPGSPFYLLFEWLREQNNRCLVRYLLAQSDLPSGSRVLEAGSGPGFATSLFARSERVALAVAVDIDLDALRQCKKRDPAIPAVMADICALPFAAGRFDLVWNSSTIEEFDSPEVAVGEMKRVVCPAGHVFVGVPYRSGPLGFQRWIKNTNVGIWIGHVFGRNELELLGKQSGLHPVKVNYYFFRFFIGMLARRM